MFAVGEVEVIIMRNDPPFSPPSRLGNARARALRPRALDPSAGGSRLFDRRFGALLFRAFSKERRLSRERVR